MSGHWTAANSPYIVDGDITVTDLQIDAGVSVLVSGDYSITVSGRLLAVAAEGDSILFSTLPDSTLNWQGIIFDGTQPGSQMIYCIVEHSHNSGARITDSAPQIQHCNFRHNSASRGGGINVLLDSGTACTIQDCLVSNNTSDGHGGGVYGDLTGSSLTIRNCIITDNSANPTNLEGNWYGGGIHIEGGDSHIIDCDISSNTSRSYSGSAHTRYGRGGGLYAYNSNMTLVRCMVNNNLAYSRSSDWYHDGHSYSYGGAIYADGSESNITVLNSIISCNSVQSTGDSPHDYTSGVFVSNGSMQITNCAITHNTREGLGREGGNLTAMNSILWENNSGSSQTAGTMDITYSCIENAADPALHNIDVNPVFISETCDDLDLSVAANSPCVDAGNPAYEYADRFFPSSYGGIRNDMGISGGPYAQDPALPTVAAVDVPADQGGSLQINWSAFPEDDAAASNPIENYLVQVVPTGWTTPLSGWTTVATIPATHAATYSAVAAVDSTYDAFLDSTYAAGSTWPAYLYRVVGSASGGTMTFDSNTDVGMAMDNIMPAAPNILLSDGLGYRNMIRTPVDQGATPDFRQTCMFRGEILSFDPYVFGEATLWDEPCTFHDDPPVEPCTTDTGIHMWSECYQSYFYYIARNVDFHGNYGAASDTLIPNFPSGVDELPVPENFSLDQNSPNPFNPTTAIKFNLPRESPVKLDVFSVSGNRVATLVDKVLATGPHKVFWNGRNDQGHEVASGVYFYKIVTPDNSATHRMVLLK